MGVAFTRVRKGVGYFPAISLSYGEKCFFNFGHRPFEYPVDGFSPLQASPPLSMLAHRSHAIPPKNSISFFTTRLWTLLQMEQQQHPTVWPQDDILIAASILFEYLASILDHEYHVVDAWYPFLIKCMNAEGALVDKLIDWMWFFMEEFEWENCMRFLFNYLGYKCRTTGLIQVTQQPVHSPNQSVVPPSRHSFPALALVLNLLRIPRVLHFVLSLETFSSLMEHIITFKQSSKVDLASLLPFVWWQGGDGEPSCDESRFLRDMGLLNAYVRVYEDVVYGIIQILHRVDIPHPPPPSSLLD
jgi:Kip1 ubiquitination-promoting complex protein 1